MSAGNRLYTPEQRETAYSLWREGGTVQATAAALGIPEGTVAYWCLTEKWVDRRREEADQRAATVYSRVLDLLLDDADRLTARLLALAAKADRDSVSLDATKTALAVLGVVPRHLLTNREPIPGRSPRRSTPDTMVPSSSLPELPAADRAALSRRLLRFSDRSGEEEEEDARR